MVASAVYILDPRGKVIISRDYRGDCPASCIERFSGLLSEFEDEVGSAPPVICDGGISYIYIRHAGLYCKRSGLF